MKVSIVIPCYNAEKFLSRAIRSATSQRFPRDEYEVIVIDDGSGSIDVSNVGGDLIVEDDGNGSINYSGVEGTVDIPEDKRRRRRRG